MVFAAWRYYSVTMVIVCGAVSNVSSNEVGKQDSCHRANEVRGPLQRFETIASMSVFNDVKHCLTKHRMPDVLMLTE